MGTQAPHGLAWMGNPVMDHQRGGSALLVLQIPVPEAQKHIYLPMYVYMPEHIRSQTKHYKCTVKK